MAVWLTTRAALLTAVLVLVAYGVRLAPEVRITAVHGLEAIARWIARMDGRI